MVDDFKSRTLSGLSWSTISQFGVQVLKMATGIALARLLSPKEFGLMGMIAVFVGFASIFINFGFGAALIQKKDAEQKHYSSIFWINIGLGITLMSILMICASWIAKFYKEPILIPVTILISANLFIGAIGSVHSTLFQKQLNFKSLAITEIVAVIFSGIIAITMASLGFGIWSLVIHSITSTVTMVTLMWYFSDWRPSFVFDWKAVKDLIGFSSNLFGFNILNYFVRNVDNLLIGRFLGSSALGLYSKAYSMMLFPLSNMSMVIGRVMFPAFSSIQEDIPRIRKLYLRITRNTALITFPLMLGLLITSDSFVAAVLGLQWSGMIPILKVFCIVGMIQSIGTLNGIIYQSQGRTDLQFKVGGTIGVMGVIAIIIGLRWGVVGVAYAYCTFSLLFLYPSIRIAVSLIGITFVEVIVNLSGVFTCALSMATAVCLLGYTLPIDWSPWRHLAVEVPFGIIIYIALIHFLKVRSYMETLELLKEQWRNRTA